MAPFRFVSGGDPYSTLFIFSLLLATVLLFILLLNNDLPVFWLKEGPTKSSRILASTAMAKFQTVISSRLGSERCLNLDMVTLLASPLTCACTVAIFLGESILLPARLLFSTSPPMRSRHLANLSSPAKASPSWPQICYLPYHRVVLLELHRGGAHPWQKTNLVQMKIIRQAFICAAETRLLMLCVRFLSLEISTPSSDLTCFITCLIILVVRLYSLSLVFILDELYDCYVLICIWWKSVWCFSESSDELAVRYNSYSFRWIYKTPNICPWIIGF